MTEYTPKEFKEKKKNILSKADMSKKGSIDKEIKKIVDEINSKEDFCTTSSCAGRITLLERKTSKKIHAKWLFTSHNPIKAKDIKNNLKSSKDVWFMQESCILHVFCRNMEAAKKYLSACRQAGFKRTGIIGLKRILIETMGNEKVETIVIKDGKVIIDEDYIDILTEEANSRMKINREKMERLLEELKKIK